MSPFTIIIPVFAETRVLAFSAFYFQQLGLEPLYALDSKKAARRKEVEKIVGREVAIYDNPGHYIEAHYERLAALSPTDWILRVDCDEVPNAAMLAYCQRFVDAPRDAYCGFERDDLTWRGDHFERVKQPFLFIDSQYRLFNRKRVKFLQTIHTPGFQRPKWKLPLVPLWHAPLSARLYHLQRAFISAKEHQEKFARYAAAGQDSKFNAQMLRQDDATRWRAFDDQEFTSLFAAWQAKT